MIGLIAGFWFKYYTYYSTTGTLLSAKAEDFYIGITDGLCKFLLYENGTARFI